MWEVGWIIFLSGLPFAHFLDKRLDIWHGHTVWVQLWLIILFGLLFLKPTKTVPNKALGAWIIWVFGSIWWMFLQGIVQTKMYSIALLAPAFHLLFLIIFYQCATQMWTVEFIKKLSRWLARSCLIVLVYCVLQLLDLDQFFKSLEHPWRDSMVGTIGNQSHLASYLAFSLPILLYQEGKRWKFAAIFCAIILLITGSIAGQLAAFVSLLWMVWFWRRKYFFALLGIGGLGIAYIILHPASLNPHGRYLAWQEFWKYFSAKPITGLGPGFIMSLSQTIKETTSPIFQWRHCHNEYFQLAIEQGLIGLAFVLNMIFQVSRKVFYLPKTKELVMLTAILIAFLLNSLVNFPMHLWLLGSFGLIAYSGIYAIAEEKSGNYDIQRNKR